MIKSVLTGIALLILAGCTTTKTETIIVPKNVYIADRYLDCENLKKKDYPKSANLTDKQVADLLVKYDARLAHCEANAKAVKKIQADAKAAESKPPQK
uniref:Rz-like spanin n=1 Tax=Ochrobactrum phage ORM_20 TaxID=2985243 RepID=A0A9N6WRY8_9VIRU|nr:Rz-like spanin [Ochrobactrum phage ORM_20]